MSAIWETPNGHAYIFYRPPARLSPYYRRPIHHHGKWILSSSTHLDPQHKIIDIELPPNWYLLTMNTGN
jgi:hypothetical protein